jgi:hypothetical protein
MTHVYFHCANSEKVLLDPCGLEVEDLVDAHRHGTQIIQQMVNSHCPNDWRAWTLHVSDEDGEEIFLMPFACVVGRLH